MEALGGVSLWKKTYDSTLNIKAMVPISMQYILKQFKKVATINH